MSLTGYVVHDQCYELAETIPGPTVERAEVLAKNTGMHLIFGMPELSEKTQATLFNTAVFVGPKGLIGKYRKMYLPTHSVFEEKGISALDTRQPRFKPSWAISDYASVMTSSSQKRSGLHG